MNILFVEDDDNKARQITSYLEAEFETIVLIPARSYHSGLKALTAPGSNFELLLLDMSMPIYDRIPGDLLTSFSHYAGRDILEEMERINVEIKAIVVTQFGVFGEGKDQINASQLHDELRVAFPHTYLGMVHYNASLSNWKNELARLIRDNTHLERK